MPCFSRTVGSLLIVLAFGLAIVGCSSSQQSSPPYVTITSDQLQQLIDSRKSMILVDLREPALYAAGHVAGARNIPFDEFPDRSGELPSNAKIVLICHTGRMGDISAKLLSERGYADVSNLSGGMAAWKGALQQ